MARSDASSSRVPPGGVLVLAFLFPLAHQAVASRGWAGAEETPAAKSDAPATYEATTPAVRIAVGFDGSCPHDLAGVKWEGTRKFRIFPSWRSSPGIDEEAVGRSTRLGFKVVNAGPVAATVDLWIDWQYHQAPPYSGFMSLKNPPLNLFLARQITASSESSISA